MIGMVTWFGNCGICKDGEGYTLFTVLEDGTLEIRGPGWKKRRHYPKLASSEQARRVAEELAIIQELIY